MLYLLDANVLIDANRDYYCMNRVPEFWKWLEDMGRKDKIKIPIEIYDEIKDGKDNLAIWIKKSEINKALLLKEETTLENVRYILEYGYAKDLTDVELERIGNDPFLIAYAKADIRNRCVVTTETSRPGRKRANRHIPDVCKSLNIKWCHSFKMLQYLDFRTNWKR